MAGKSRQEDAGAMNSGVQVDRHFIEPGLLEILSTRSYRELQTVIFVPTKRVCITGVV